MKSFSNHSRTLSIDDTYFGSRTDVGLLRDHNEDSLIVAPPLFAVADGMGGHAAGEVASEIAVTTLLEQSDRITDTKSLGKVIEDANRAVILAADERQGRAGMGTTLTAALLKGNILSIAHVGDSRAYLLHQGKLQQITRDHSLMNDMIEAGELTPEEARVHPHRSVITRALGSDARMVPDLYELSVESGDRLLLCSDGLSGMVSDKEIEHDLNLIQKPQECVDVLVDGAIEAGGHDNITAIVVDIVIHNHKKHNQVKIKSRAWLLFISLLLIALIGGAAFATYSYIHNSAYLIAENGFISVYRGIPDDFLGAPLSQLEYTSEVPVKDLQPGVASRLTHGGIRVDNLEVAEQLLNDYQKDSLTSSTTPEQTKKMPSAKELKKSSQTSRSDSTAEQED